MEKASSQNEYYLLAFRNKKLDAIQTFYMENWPKVFNMILKQGGNEETAKDIMQNGMLALYTNIQNQKYTNRSSAKISTYFIQLCKFQWYDILKSAHVRKTQSINQVEYDEPGVESDVVEVMARTERHKQLHKFIQQLGNRCQQILKAFYWDDKSMREIAERFELSEESAKNAKYRCMKKLKDLMNTTEMDS